MIKPNERNETTEAAVSLPPEVALAKGVLRQAKQDLRRFAAADDAVGREMYADAYSWVMANDFSWPYSFQNVCKVLRFSPEFLRAELFADAEAGWFVHSRRIAGRISSSLRGSLASVFGDHRSSSNGRPSNRPVLAH